MKAKKFLALFLAAVMTMSLAIPAMAAKKVKGGKDQPAAVPAVTVDKIEDTDKDGNPDPRLPLIENGAAIHTGKYEAIYIKQANDIVIWVKADDTRSEAEIIAQARASDNSLNKADKGTTTVIHGNGEVQLHKNDTTLVVVENGILTVNGPISHIDFVGNDAPTEDELGGDGKVSAAFTITKYLNSMEDFGANFTFEIRDSKGTVVGSMISDDMGNASTTVDVAPGVYTICETGLDLNEYEAVKDIEVIVDESGQVIFPEDNGEEVNYIINYELGGLDVNKPTVKQEYDELWHELEYEYSEEGTRVSSIWPKDLPEGISGEKYTKKGDNTNGFTLLWLNKALFDGKPEGVNIRIAYSNPQNTPCFDIAPANPWEEAIPAVYNLKVEDDKLIITSPLPKFGVNIFTEMPKKNPNSDMVETVTRIEEYEYRAECTIPDEDFLFYIHYDVGYYTDTIKGCNPDPDSVVTRPCERVISPENVVVTVKNSNGEVVDASGKLPHGEYTVTVSVGDEVIGETNVTVNPGKTTEVTFDELYMEPGADVYRCAITNCPHLPVEP